MKLPYKLYYSLKLIMSKGYMKAIMLKELVVFLGRKTSVIEKENDSAYGWETASKRASNCAKLRIDNTSSDSSFRALTTICALSNNLRTYRVLKF